MKPIPPKIRKALANDEFMERCCVTNSTEVTFEHCWTYSGRQINEIWAIVPLDAKLNTSHPPREVKDKCKLISLQRAKDLGMWKELKEKYPKKDWEQEFLKLSN